MPSPKINIEYSPQFKTTRKKYTKNSRNRFEDFKKAIKRFQSDPFYPGLHIEKIKSTHNVYTVRLNISDRIFFIWKNEITALIVDIGKHDKYRKY